MDHIGALQTIYNRHEEIKYITTRAIYNSILEKSKILYDEKRFLMVDEKHSNNIKYFELMHDVPTVGYILYDKGESLCYISDSGWLKKELFPILTNHTHYAIESNYDRTMQLLDTTRNELLKKRCLGSWGHMDSYVAIQNAVKLVGENTKNIIWTHRSTHCNTLELDMLTHDNYLTTFGHRTLFKNIKMSYAMKDELLIVKKGDNNE